MRNDALLRVQDVDLPMAHTKIIPAPISDTIPDQSSQYPTSTHHEIEKQNNHRFERPPRNYLIFLYWAQTQLREVRLQLLGLDELPLLRVDGLGQDLVAGGAGAVQLEPGTREMGVGIRVTSPKIGFRLFAVMQRVDLHDGHWVTLIA